MLGVEVTERALLARHLQGGRVNPGRIEIWFRVAPGLHSQSYSFILHFVLLLQTSSKARKTAHDGGHQQVSRQKGRLAKIGTDRISPWAFLTVGKPNCPRGYESPADSISPPNWGSQNPRMAEGVSEGSLEISQEKLWRIDWSETDNTRWDIC